MWNEGSKTFLAAEKLEAKRRVKLSTATQADPPEVIYADKDDAFIGHTEYAAVTNDMVAVALKATSRTFEAEVTISSAINVGTDLYTQNDGLWSDATNAGSAEAVALQVAGASNEHIEILLK